MEEVDVLMKNETDPLVVASNVYKFLYENDRVRVMEVVFKPGAVAKMHHHTDHVVYAVNGGKLNFTSEGKTQDMEIKTGSVVFLKAQDHEANNVGNTTVDLIVVELKK
jgi:quercetin dioxygenase-like cupin family protein